MKTNQHCPMGRRLRNHFVRLAAALAMTATAATPADAAVILSPTLPGQYAAGTGANATFVSIDGNWTGTAVYWNENAKRYANNHPGNNQQGGFQPIGSFSWGTGIWGLVDWEAINLAGSAPVVGSWSGQVATIDHADRGYAGSGYATTWGAIGPLPTGLFGSTELQDNWTAHYTGYLRITDPGDYNFGVLYDDGFFLRIWGANGSMVEISSDFLSPRDRLGFAEDLSLGTGLYRFELGVYDHLEVGAVNLAWLRNGNWVTVPAEYLVTDPVPIPTPGTVGLLLAAVGALAAVRLRRKRG
ncbi:MAG TPA: PEP-CTERM sorting domain-containing protein [Burkholderiaceae bacterium]|nr:PEP-CTERM sorting domain-containing protein [Burkholderiaceae bacterium]